MSYSIVIPSRNIKNLTKCVAALRVANERARVIVVNDGLRCKWEQFFSLGAIDGPVEIVEGSKPFFFARNCNIGIRAAGDDDVALLNDDALLEVGSHFSMLTLSGYGITAASTNVTAYMQQRRRCCEDRRQYRELPLAAFVCVYIHRCTIETVGLLDERFTSYGGEDVDYCLRVREAGLRVGVSDYCFVDHSKLTSTFRGPHPQNSAPGNCAESDRIGREKWGSKWPNGRHG